jgi:hypothetical protein
MKFHHFRQIFIKFYFWLFFGPIKELPSLEIFSIQFCRKPMETFKHYFKSRNSSVFDTFQFLVSLFNWTQLFAKFLLRQLENGTRASDQGPVDCSVCVSYNERNYKIILNFLLSGTQLNIVWNTPLQSTEPWFDARVPFSNCLNKNLAKSWVQLNKLTRNWKVSKMMNFCF